MSSGVWTNGLLRKRTRDASEPSNYSAGVQNQNDGRSFRMFACVRSGSYVSHFLASIASVACLSFASNVSSAGAPQAVAFDAPAIVVAEPLDASVHNSPSTGGTFLRLKITVSTMIHPEYRGNIDELVVSIDSPSLALRVIDFWPKTEMYSQVQGTITVANEMQRNQNFAFNVAGGYEPFVRGNANGDFHSKQQVQENYQRQPPMQLLTSSGTVNRGYGAFFKFRPGPTPVLEGDRELALLVEAPAGWRADLLHVSMQAVGQASNGFGGVEKQTLGSTELWTAAHLLGDEEAAGRARRYMSTEQAVRRLASTNSHTIQQRRYPLCFTKLVQRWMWCNPRFLAITCRTYCSI